jgi:hypothetical protein
MGPFAFIDGFSGAAVESGSRTGRITNQFLSHMSFRNLFAWISTSSADPTQMAMMFKAILLGALPIATAMAGLACQGTGFCLDTSLFPQAIDPAYNIVVEALTIVSLIVGAVGLARKIWLGRWARPAA